MQWTLDSQRLCAFHDAALASPGWPGQLPQHPRGVWARIATNHRCNALLWEQEDLARRRGVADAAIVANKRAIDVYNQRRNDAIEQIDAAILDGVAGIALAPDAWLNSETAGALIDRLSIASLKRFHMHQQCLRHDADEAHRHLCREKLACIEAQRADLRHCFDALLRGLAEGRCYFKLYRQFKMYNDPALNPHLQAARPPDARAA